MVCRYMDYQRQHLALVELEALVSYTPCSQGELDEFGTGSDGDAASAAAQTRVRRLVDTPPKVSLLLPDNVAVFLLARRVLMNLGLRYRRRLRVYVVVAAATLCRVLILTNAGTT